MKAEPRLISNQVYEHIQPITIEEEIIPKRIVLYANNFSGLDPTPVTDEELNNLLGNTVGMAGNNVLVQLKKKFSTFRNGPWYIDSRDGVVYIHNRKNSISNVHDYTYNRENGELLSATFTIQEVYKPFAGIKSALDALGKGLGRITHQLDDYFLPDSSEMPPDLGSETLNKHNRRFTTNETDTVEDVMRRNGYGEGWKLYRQSEGKLESNYMGSIWEGKRLTKEYNSKTPAQKQAQIKKAIQKAYGETDRNAQLNYLFQKDPMLKEKWIIAVNSIKDYGENSPYAQYYKNDFIKSASKYQVPAKSVGFEDYSTKIFTVSLSPFKNTGPQSVQKACDKALNSWIAKNQVKRKLSSAKLIKGSEKLYTFKKLVPVQGSRIGSFTNVIMTGGTVNIEYTGYGGYRTYTNGAQVVQDALGRSLDGKKAPNFSNLLGDVNKALHNAGKGKKEKQLLATVRVIGNPDIEVSNSLGLYNVGKKYSGQWYVKKVSHLIEPGQGYVCDIELQKHLPKPGASGDSSLVNTQEGTVDNTKASHNPVSAKNSTELRKKTKNAPGKKVNPKSHKGNNSTWQGYLDIPWTASENAAVDAVIQNGRKAGMSDAEISKLVGNMANNIARRRASEANGYGGGLKVSGYTTQVVQGKNGRIIKVHSNGNIGIDPNVKVPKGKYTSKNFQSAMRRNNINKKKK